MEGFNQSTQQNPSLTEPVSNIPSVQTQPIEQVPLTQPVQPTPPTQSGEPPPPPPQNHSFLSKLLIILLIVLVLFALFYAGTYFNINSKISSLIGSQKPTSLNKTLTQKLKSQKNNLISTKATVSFKKLGRLPDQYNSDTRMIGSVPILFSNDSNHSAYKIYNLNQKTDQGILDGQILKRSEDGKDAKIDISDGSFTFSHNSKKFAYREYEGNYLYRVVVDGQPGKSYQAGLVRDITFSPDSQHLAYIVVAASGDSFVVVDGKEGKKYHNISRIAFSPDSQRVAYKATVDEKHEIAVVDGLEGKVYYGEGSESIIFSSDSKTFVYTASNEAPKITNTTANLLVVNGEEQKKSHFVSKPTISPDGAHIAYIATASLFSIFSKQFIVLDGKEQEKYGNIVSENPRPIQFSPDSQKIAYLAREGNQTFIIINGKKQATYPEHSYVDIFFSPDSKTLVYLVQNFVSKKYSLVINNKDNPLDFSPKNVFFSPDSSKVVLLYETDEEHKGIKIFNIHDDNSISPITTQAPLIFDQLSATAKESDPERKLLFNSDSKTFTFGAAKDKDIFKVEVKLE